jgi:4'-phosphopantetheinyl transferase
VHVVSETMAAPTTSPLVRVVDTAEWMRHDAPPSELLSAAERQRAQRFRREADCRDFIAAHLLARQVVAELVGVDVTAVSLTQSCAVCGVAGHGAPQVIVPDHRPVFTSWSHTAGRVGAIASFGRVGLDLERVDDGADVRATAGVALSAGEVALVDVAASPGVAFLHWWTRKEALVKVGAIELDDFATTDLSAHPDRWEAWTLSSWHDPGLDAVVATATATQTPTPTPGSGSG